MSYASWRFPKYSDLVWSWKDDLPKRRKAFYAKYFRGRGTLISLQQLPNFLALRGSAPDPADHERFYHAGRITADALAIWRALDEHGPLATLELRHACKMETKTGNVRFKRAILDLQKLLIVVHSGTRQETGAWASARFDLTCRLFPRQATDARAISPSEARLKLAAKFADRHPGAAALDLARLFGWSKAEAVEALESAKDGGAARKIGTRR